MRSLWQRFQSWWKKPEQPMKKAESEPLVSMHSATPPDLSQNGSSAANLGALSLNQEAVYQVLRNCRDPEIPVNIVDLGLIYDVQIDDDQVHVKMTLTTQGCGMGGYIAQDAEEQIRTIPGVNNARVEIVWDPPWDPSMISAGGRRTLGLPD